MVTEPYSNMVTENYSHMVTGATEEIRHISLDDNNARRGSLLLPYHLVRQTEEGALHKSTSISQWEYPRDNWSRPDFVGPSTIGDELQFSQF